MLALLRQKGKNPSRQISVVASQANKSKKATAVLFVATVSFRIKIKMITPIKMKQLPIIIEIQTTPN